MPAKKKPSKNTRARVLSAAIFSVGLLVILLAMGEAYTVGWGSGHFLGRLSLKWVLTLVALYIPAIAFLALLFTYLFATRRLNKLGTNILRFRNHLGNWRWLLLALFLLLPAWLAFYSSWGLLFTGLFSRILIFAFCLSASAFSLTKEKSTIVDFSSFLFAGLLLGSVLVLAESFVLVNDYPFALHWSEGNRIWDYSVVFGRDLYNYSGPEPIFAWIDQGRQALWGLPFLVPNVPIWIVRLWGAILVTLPYAILGWVAFRPMKQARDPWLAAGLWSLIFLNQGPIYTPLVLAAILVALARRQPIWLALPLVYIAGHYAGLSRFSWRFAPAIWAVVLTFGDAVLLHGNLRWRDWLRAAALGLAGIWSKGLPIVIGVIVGLLPFLSPASPGVSTDPTAETVETLEGLQAASTHHPFLWERLFPNPIFPPGILLALALATLPLILLWVYLMRHKIWKTALWQQIATVAGLGALLVVGVIASAKVGGGTDLHNMDMFLVGLVLVAGLAWGGGLHLRLKNLLRDSATVRWLFAGMILIPAFLPMVEGRPQELPTEERTQFVLERIQETVACARQYGEVLFMDQRQLITFGQMGDLPLVVDYEKKFVMDQALSGNEVFFEQFRSDLASARFSLIVTEREAILYKEPDIESIGDSLNEENNAWVTWVTTPLLSYYQSVGDFKDAAIEMFMPIERNFDCP